jgi:proline iminopeptidase
MMPTVGKASGPRPAARRTSPTGRAAAGAAALGAVYALLVRPRMLRWGATDEECAEEYPGRELVPDGVRGATMAVTIDVPPAGVWPWLVQMGTDRGWYSWDLLDNFGRPSAGRIHPEWQEIRPGDRFIGKPDGSQSWQVAALDPERFLGLRMSLDLRGRQFDPARPRPRHYTDSTWGFLLRELPGQRTRLVVSGYWALRPRWLRPVLSVAVLEPAHWIMQTRQFANLTRRAERAGTGRAGGLRPGAAPPGSR